MSQNQTPDDPRRKQVESEYITTFSRLLETPLSQKEFDEEWKRLGEKMWATGAYSQKQFQALYDALDDANDASRDIQSKELYSAKAQVRELTGDLDALEKLGALSPKFIQSKRMDVEVLESRIKEKEPEVFRDAQKFFADSLDKRNPDGTQLSEEARAEACKTFYSLLLNAGLDRDRASGGYYALEDAFKAQSIIATEQRGEPAQKALSELSQAIEIVEGKPPVFDAANIQRLKALETNLKGRTEYIEDPARDGVPNLNPPDVIGDFRIDPVEVAKQANDRIEKLQDLMDWLKKRPHKEGNEIHSLGGFYSYFFNNGDKALEALKKSLDPNGEGDPAVRQYKAVQYADKLLDSLHSNHRNMSPEDLVKYVDSLQKKGVSNANDFADAIGEIPRVGPIARGVLKSGVIGLQYARGDISATEAATGAIKEGVSSTVDTVLGKMQFKGPMREAAWVFTTSVGNELQAEMGKAISRLQKDPDLDKAQLFKEAFSKALIKGFTDTFGKQAEKLTEAVPYKQYGTELFELAVGLAKKFGIEKQVEDMLDNLKSLADRKQGSNGLKDAADSRLAAVEDPTKPFTAEERRNLSAAIALAAQRDGLQRIDGLTMSADSTRVIAVEGDMRAPSNKTSSVNLRDGMTLPADRSLEQLAQLQTASPDNRVEATNQTPSPRPVTI